MNKMIVFMIAISVLLSACNGGQPIPAATPLPTAVPPGAMPAGEDGGWIVGFQHEFGPDFWAEGVHNYGFYIQCAVPGYEDFGSEWITFEN